MLRLEMSIFSSVLYFFLIFLQYFFSFLLFLSFIFTACLQCFDAVGWVSGRDPAHKNLTDEVLAWYLLQGSANSLHMVQLMPLPRHHVCFSKIQNGLSFLYRLTWVLPDKGS